MLEDSYQWDFRSRLYYHARSGFYHDPVAGWSYSTREGRYYRFQDGIYVLWETPHVAPHRPETEPSPTAAKPAPQQVVSAVAPSLFSPTTVTQHTTTTPLDAVSQIPSLGPNQAAFTTPLVPNPALATTTRVPIPIIIPVPKYTPSVVRKPLKKAATPMTKEPLKKAATPMTKEPMTSIKWAAGYPAWCPWWRPTNTSPNALGRFEWRPPWLHGYVLEDKDVLKGRGVDTTRTANRPVKIHSNSMSFILACMHICTLSYLLLHFFHIS
ncbi:putative OCRE domain-containing protein [Helianthus debilis subsp. tardiflorus]